MFINYLYKYFKNRKLEKHCHSKIGSELWLVCKEKYYGGVHRNVKRKKVSPFDPRSKKHISSGGMIGGDRMYCHGYAKNYEIYLRDFLKLNNITVLEVGILRGTGLAIWCDLFPNSRVIGLDIDLSHFEKNLKKMKKKGAFSCNYPEIYEFDQLVINNNYVKNLLGGDLVSICFDDGLHSDESILKTFDSLYPFLADDFVYFIEDNSTAFLKLKAMYSHLCFLNFGELTIIKRGP